MSIKPDHWIARMAREERMIEPFAESSVDSAISFGLSAYGYDFRVDQTFRIFKGGGVIDPKRTDPSMFESFEGSVCEIPARSFVLGHSVEYFRIPRNILTICFGKSSYARCGVMVNITPFEPEWEGHATLSIANTASAPVKIYAGEGIAQLLFLESDQLCETSYSDKRGKYQAQQGIVHSRVKSEESSSGPATDADGASHE